MRRKVTPVEATEDGDFSFSLVAAVLNQETLIMLKSRMKEWFDMKVWYPTACGSSQILICCIEAMDRS